MDTAPSGKRLWKSQQSGHISSDNMEIGGSNLIIKRIGHALTDDLRERLIEEVRIRPNIWNAKLKAFRDVKSKEFSWHQIAANLNLSVEECQRSFKSLRTMYAKYLSDLRAGSAAPIEVKQEYFQSMTFLNDFIKPRRILSTMVTLGDDGHSFDGEEILPQDTSAEIVADGCSSPTPSDASGFLNSLPQGALGLGPGSRKRKCESEGNDSDQQAQETAESLKSIGANLVKNEQDDEYDVFGKLVAMKLRRIHPDISDEIIYQIETALYSGLQYKPMNGGGTRGNF